MAIMAVTTSSAVISYHRISVMDAELRTITAHLQRARQQAISNSTSQPYSVKFLSNKYVIFPGTTYSSSDPNNVSHYMDTSVFVNSTYTNNIVTFSVFTGRTSTDGSITLSAFGTTKIIHINSLGIVEDIS